MDNSPKSSTASNTLLSSEDKPMDSSMTDQSNSKFSTKMTSNSSDRSFDILSRNPSEEYSDQKQLIHMGEQSMSDERNRLVMANEQLKHRVTEYERLDTGEIFSEVKELIKDLSANQGTEVAGQQPNISSQQKQDIVSKMINLCDQMFTTLNDPNSVDSKQLKDSMLSFIRIVMSIDKENQKLNKKWLETLHSQNDTLQENIDEREHIFPKSSQQDQCTQTDMSDEYHPETHLTQVMMKKQFRSSNVTDELEELRKENMQQQQQINKLTSANSQWEEYSKKNQQQFQAKITSLKHELGHAEEVIKSLKICEEERGQYVNKTTIESEERIKVCEEQRQKAETFASGQAAKVDDLKKKLKKETMKSEDLDEANKQLASVTEFQKDEIDSLKLQLRHAKEAVAKHETAQMHGSLELTLDNRNPRENPHIQHQTIAELKTEILVLQQQVKIFKDDFEGERRDREKAHSELSTIRNHFGQIKDDLKAVQEELSRKNREVEALKAARDQDRIRLHKKEEEVQRLNATINRAVAEQSRLQAQIDRLKREAEYQQPPPYEYVSRENLNTQPFSHPVQPEDTSPSSFSGTATWTCTSCTYNNPAHLERCEMCGNIAPSRQNMLSHDIAPSNGYVASHHHHGDMYNRTEQCDNGIEWVKPACL